MASRLTRFVDVMYYRFEFARAATLDDYSPPERGFRFGKENLPEVVRLFRRLLDRPSFLLPSGKPKYLDDLKHGLRVAGKRRDLARRVLREWVETSRAPLCHHESVLWNRVQAPFFPKADELGDDLREYCYQLCELQDFLIQEVGIRPGTLLPVWIDQEPNRRGDPLTLGVLPVRRSLIDTLVHYILWEYDRDYGYEAPLPGNKRNDLFLDEALRWGRVSLGRSIALTGVSEQSGVPVHELEKMSRHKLKRLVEALPSGFGAKEFPESFSKEMLINYAMKGDSPLEEATTRAKRQAERSGVLVSSRPRKHSTVDAKTAARDPSLRKRIRLAIEASKELYDGAYKDLW